MGRQPEQRISRFNVATGVLENLKFARLCRILQVDELKGIAFLVLFWRFVAGNRAMTGSIADVEPWEIGRACLWNPATDGAPEILIRALKKAGYVSDGKNYPDELDGTVHDWFENQPLVRDALRAREARRRDDEGDEKKQSPTPDSSGEHPGRIPDELARPPLPVKTEAEYHDVLVIFEGNWNAFAQTHKLPKISFYAKTATAIARRQTFILAMKSGEFNPDDCLYRLSLSYLLDSDIDWRPNFDWLFRKKKGVPNYITLQEGGFDARKDHAAKHSGRSKLGQWAKPAEDGNSKVGS